MPNFEIKTKGRREETVELDMPTIGMVLDTIRVFWTDDIFPGGEGCPFDAATIRVDGKIVADGWRESAGWMWDDIDESYDER